jgi:hypothetical protein
MFLPLSKVARRRCWRSRLCDQRRSVVVKKRLSGARRRSLARAIKRDDLVGRLVAPRLLKRFDKPGRPEGTRTTKGRTKKLRAFLIWIGRPDLSDESIITLLRTPGAGIDEQGEHRRQQIVAAYKRKTRHTLQRDIATAQRKIWGDVKASRRKAWARSVRADAPLGGRGEPEKTAWERAGMSQSTWYRQRRRRRKGP